MRDYVRWHDAYDDPQSALSARLRVVQGAIGRLFDRSTGPVRVLSVCAGQGHDILGVLQDRPQDRARVTGALVELEPENVAAARRRAAEVGVALSLVEADAGTSDSYSGLVPADLVLLVGIMGNISGPDVERLIHTSRQFCSPEATVIWTRGDQEPDLVPDIRRWFGEAGFEEESCEAWAEGDGMRVGVERLIAPPDPLVPGRRIFTFLR